MKSLRPKLPPKPCVFCKIVHGNTNDHILYQDQDMVAFYDIRPAADTHILIIPTVHIDSIKTVQASDYDLLLKFKDMAYRLLKEHGHDPVASRLGFHIPPYNTVDHLHLHVLGGEFEPPSKRSKYDPKEIWFLDLEQLLANLKQEHVCVHSPL